MEALDLVRRRCRLIKQYNGFWRAAISMVMFCLMFVGYDIAVLLGRDYRVFPMFQMVIFAVDAIFAISALVTKRKLASLDAEISKHIPLTVKLPYDNVDDAMSAICLKRRRKPLSNGGIYCRITEKGRLIKTLLKRMTYIFTIPAVYGSDSEFCAQKDACVKEAAEKYNMKLRYTIDDLRITMSVFIYVTDEVNEDIRRAVCRTIETEEIESFIVDMILDAGKMELLIPGCAGKNSAHCRLYTDLLCRLAGMHSGIDR